MQLKKISAIFLAAALMIFSLATVASAEDTKIFEVEVEALTTTSTLSSSPIIYSPGEEFTVKISAGQNTGITSVKFKIDYDETALEVVLDKCKVTNLFTASDELTRKVSSTGDEYFLFYSDNYPKISTATGTFVELTFVAKEVCVKNSAVAVSLFKNSNGFCVVQTASGSEVVPFASNGDTFSIHDLDTESKIITPVKCLEDGYATYSCKACKESVVGNVVPAIGHDIIHHAAQEPTCTEIGWDAYDTCSRCDYTTYVELEALGHDLKHHAAQAPTCTEIGWDEYDTCSRCDYTTYNELPALGHKYGETTVIEPEYNQDGYSTHTCTVCGHEEKFDFKPALTYILGDINGDETINDADAVYLLMHTFFPEDYPINQVGDFNGDNSVTDADAVYLLMYTFFPEDYPIA